MEQTGLIGLRDVPIENIRLEELGMTPYVESLSEFVLACATPMTVAIQGDWGSGKTSFMNMMREILADRAHSIWFNTWQYSQFDMQSQLTRSLLKYFVDELGKGAEKNSKLSDLAKGAGRIVSTMLIERTLGSANAGNLSAHPVQETLDLASEIKGLKDQLQKLAKEKAELTQSKRIVVFVDDLDRLQPERAVEFLEVLKNFLDVESCVFVLAIDYSVVVQGIKKKFNLEKLDEKGRSFFDKIIQLPFNMPVGNYDVKKYCASLLKEIGIDIASVDIGQYLNLVNCSVGFNPRSLKRVFNLLLLLNIVAHKQNLFAGNNLRRDKQRVIFAVLCMQSALDPVYDFIRQRSENLDEKLFQEMMDEATLLESEQYSSIFSDVEDADRQKYAQRVALFMQVFYSAIQLSGNPDDSCDRLGNDDLANLRDVLSFSSLTSVDEREGQSERRIKLTLAQLRDKEEGFVGVQFGVAGLKRMPVERIGGSNRFQFSAADMTGRRNWMTLAEFLEIVDGRGVDLPSA